MHLKKFVLVGAGARARSMFAKPFMKEFGQSAQLVGVFDINSVRSKLLSQDYGGIPVFGNFQDMLMATKPDTVIVATSDDTHHLYIIEALDSGCDVISEKPMTIDSDKCKAIMEAERRSGCKVTVTFNLRFVPYMARIKQLLMEGAVGDILHVSLDWFLDRSHGADYFRRWHAQLARSGGLLVHKSTHHFDILNWWLDSEPEKVQAFGNLSFYGPNREQRGERCITCEFKSSCELFYDIAANDGHKRIYLEAEHVDGYIRDRCVFGEHIDIYDTMNVHVNYANGALLNYSLVAYSPVEGWRATITGRDGRMEIGSFMSGTQAYAAAEEIRITKTDGEQIVHRIPTIQHEHGGGDERLRRMIFVGDVEDTLGQQAGSSAGAHSLLIGAAANESIAKHKQISITEILA
jgi:predicted dehydrogenase